MKLKINMPAVISLGGALLLVLVSAGCSSCGGSARCGSAAQCPTTGSCEQSSAGHVRVRSLGFVNDSAVSPLGDAPGERDLEVTGVWPAGR